jgi:hemerythrin-like domain-containing protein
MSSTSTSARREPFPILFTGNLDPKSHAADKCAVEMTLVHNLFIRAINSMYYHAPLVKESQDIRDFLRFCEAFVSAVGLHHDAEETAIFPYWIEMAGDPDLMKENIDEHQVFHDGLERLKEYSIKTAAETYRSDDLCAILDDFVPQLVSHLTREIPTLLELRKYPTDKVMEGFDRGVKASQGHASNDEQIPFVLGCNDVTFEGGKHHFPPLPSLLVTLVVWWYGKKYQGAWRFCPSDLYGRPKAKPLFSPEVSSAGHGYQKT